VLIRGQTGTGKELVARAIYQHSGRAAQPFIPVNSGAIPEMLLESELFGHERGAFTGAHTRRIGRFEQANHGTIFLDEVGELPLNLQAKLLRVLQDGEFERLGSGKTIKVDVRVIAATNRNLREAVEHGRFRADLYYRLNVYPIEVPPLRERKQDIRSLAQIFLDEAGPRLGKRFDPIPDEILRALVSYDWPGNVRELENLIARAAVTSPSENLQLPGGWDKEAPGANSSEVSLMNSERSSNGAYDAPAEITLEAREKAQIQRVLEQMNWRIQGLKGAALILGVHPNTLRSRMQKLGIKRPNKLRNTVESSTK
jgi:transcriptional regulator with GAF, ATPase, and Fis domain